MHMLLWLRGCLSPQNIRDRIMNPNSDFQQRMVEYLESVHSGEFLTGNMADVKAKIEENTNSANYKDPTQTLPEQPPPLCNELDHKCNNDCSNKSQLNVWWKRFADTVDDLILRSNVHNCGRNLSSGEKADKKDRPTCMTKHGTCKARFPRQIFEQT